MPAGIEKSSTLIVDRFEVGKATAERGSNPVSRALLGWKCPKRIIKVAKR